ncbi:MAG: cytochrome P450 [Myxococcales bacterium]|nr:cytochrome P450 [Myxococcales bacterium]
MSLPATVPVLAAPPLIGALLEFRDRRLDLLLRVVRECGDLARVPLLHKTAHVLSSPSLIHAMLTEQASSFHKSAVLAKFSRPLMGNGMLVAEGGDHRRQRKLIAPGLKPGRIAGYAAAMAALTEHAQRSWQDSSIIDVGAELTKMTLEIAAQTMFSSSAAEHAEVVGAAVHINSQYMMDGATSLVNVPFSWPTPTNRRVRASIARLEKIVFDMIRHHRAAGDQGDILSMLLAARDEDDGSTLSDAQVRDEVMTLFVAGHETTASSLTWALVLLARHPEIAARLRQEADSVLAGRTPTFDDLPRLPYALQVFKETLRLYPPAPVVGREAIAPVQLGSVQLPAGAWVLANIYGVHRRAELFAEPNRFNPDRFAPEVARQLPRGALVPFGDGPRVCICNHFAMMEGQILLASLAQRVELQPLSSTPIEAEALVTIRPKTAVRMRVKRRS